MSEVFPDRLVVQWTVPSIAYTPVTYVLEYGTRNDSLVPSGDSVTSGDDLDAVDRTYNRELKGLRPGTKYYYSIVARNSVRTTRTTPSFIYTKETGKTLTNTELLLVPESLKLDITISAPALGFLHQGKD